jgi:hypothetical protein
MEDRDILVVALGKELAADAWLTDHGRRSPVNKIRVIELRSDRRYGGFFEHQPASARVDLEAIEPGRVAVRITDMLGEEILVVLPVAPDARGLGATGGAVHPLLPHTGSEALARYGQPRHDWPYLERWAGMLGVAEGLRAVSDES